MAVSTFASGLMLDTWRRIVQQDIWLFNQLRGDGVIKSSCDVYVQSDWDLIGRGMNDAFSRVHRFLNFAPYPVWLYEDVPLAYGDGVEGLAVRLSSGYVQTIGKRITTAIQSNATVTYSDEDGDGVEDTATITVATAVDVSEIAVFFRTADGAPESANDAWRVQPLTMRASGGNVTITGHKSLFVNPSAVWDTPYSNPNYDERQAGDTGTAGHFVTTVDVYRVHADTTDAVVIMGCDGGDESVSATIVNAQEGVIRLSGTS